MEFRWNERNWEHAQRHGVDPEDAEHAVDNAEPPYPRDLAEGKRVVWGRGRAGQFLQVIFVLDDEETAFIIHARFLNDREKKRYRRMRR
jgi:uncharacterized DUF497 family protein